MCITSLQLSTNLGTFHWHNEVKDIVLNVCNITTMVFDDYLLFFLEVILFAEEDG